MNPDTHTRQLIRARLLPVEPTPIDVASLRATEWSPQFEQLMRNRLVLGAVRYGLMHDKTRRYKNVQSAIKRLETYLDTGNQEHLVDAANLCLMEFVKPGSHPQPHLSPVDDGDHAEKSPC